MPNGPLGGPRPFAIHEIEVNVFFSDQVSKNDVTIVGRIVRNMFRGVDRVSGPYGELQNAISIGLKGTNQFTLKQIREFKDEIEEHKQIEDIEIIT